MAPDLLHDVLPAPSEEEAEDEDGRAEAQGMVDEDEPVAVYGDAAYGTGELLEALLR